MRRGVRRWTVHNEHEKAEEGEEELEVEDEEERKSSPSIVNPLMRVAFEF